MSVSWSPVFYVDIIGSVLMLVLSGWSALLSWHWAKQKSDDFFRNYLFLFTLAIVFFAISRSFGHLVKQLLLFSDQVDLWLLISPYSGAVNSIIFVVIFAFGIYFHRFQTMHTEMEYYKNNLEELIDVRTDELRKSKHTLENILNNSNPICITSVDFDLIRANDAYFALWPQATGLRGPQKCYQSRPGTHCHTEQCPMRQIINGTEYISHEVSKTVHGINRDFIATSRPFRDVDGELIGMVESFQDVTELKLAEQSMRDSEERFRLIFAANPDPVILASLEQGEILDVNPAFETATGITRPDAIGKTSVELNLWVDLDVRHHLRQNLNSHGEINNLEVEFRVHGDQIRVGLVSARLLSLNHQPCILLVIRDITTEKAAEHALLEMDRIKSEFISTAAHELNTPLSAIMGYTEFLRNPDDFGGFSPEQMQEFLDELYAKGETLTRIVDDLLDISRIESGRPAPLTIEEIDLFELLHKKVAFFQAHERKHRFRLTLPHDSDGPILDIDPHRIQQVLDNLLTNAVKYSPEGTTIVVQADKQPAGWELKIIDQGRGMTREQLARIFERFYRVDATNTAIGGLGLGMSIVKQIVEAHGGTIQIESTLNVGTTATVILPLRTAHEVSAVH